MKKIRNLLAALMVVLQLIILQPWAVYVWGAALTEPVIESQAAVLMDGDTGEILYEKNGTEQHYCDKCGERRACSDRSGNEKRADTL